MWQCIWLKITKAKKLVHQRENIRVILSAVHTIIPLWAHNALYLIKTLGCCNQFTQKSHINYASSLWCLCTIDAFQILSDSDLIFWWAHQQSEIMMLKTRNREQSQVVQPQQLQIQSVCSDPPNISLSQFSNWRLPGRAKINTLNCTGIANPPNKTANTALWPLSFGKTAQGRVSANSC